jgi:hypothetical protein
LYRLNPRPSAARWTVDKNVAAQGFRSRKQDFRLGVNPVGYGLAYAVGEENFLVEDPRERGSEQWSLVLPGLAPEQVITRLAIGWGDETAPLQELYADYQSAFVVADQQMVRGMGNARTTWLPGREIVADGRDGLRGEISTIFVLPEYELTILTQVAYFRNPPKTFQVVMKTVSRYVEHTSLSGVMFDSYRNQVTATAFFPQVFERVLETLEFTK